MSHLKALKLTAAQPAHVQADPVERAREKVIGSLTEQKAMAEAKIAGQHYAPTHMVWRKNEAGERMQVEAPKRIRTGWFKDAAGNMFFSLRYAGKAVEFAKGKNAIEVGEFEKVPAIIDELVAAVRAGELDAQLAAVANERSKQLRRKTAA
jgi:hypothetical protein